MWAVLGCEGWVDSSSCVGRGKVTYYAIYASERTHLKSLQPEPHNFWKFVDEKGDGRGVKISNSIVGKY